MRVQTLRSYAKINLFLDVGKKIKKTKLHNIQSLTFLTNIYDEIQIKKNNYPKDIIRFYGQFGNYIGKNNNSLKQSLLLLRKRGFIKKKYHYDIWVRKNIPVFAGLGGGSSNAATIIRYFIKKKALSNQDIDYFSKIIGSDIRLFFKSSQIFQKNLYKVRSLKKKYKFYFILVYPFLKCSTKEIYKKLKVFKKIKNRNTYQRNSKMELANSLKLETNSLEQVVISKFTIIKEILNELNLVKDCHFSRVTGSGSACFGLFSKKKSADLGLRKIKKKFPKFWCVVGKTI